MTTDTYPRPDPAATQAALSDLYGGTVFETIPYEQWGSPSTFRHDWTYWAGGGTTGEEVCFLTLGDAYPGKVQTLPMCSEMDDLTADAMDTLAPVPEWGGGPVWWPSSGGTGYSGGSGYGGPGYGSSGGSGGGSARSISLGGGGDGSSSSRETIVVIDRDSEIIREEDTSTIIVIVDRKPYDPVPPGDPTPVPLPAAGGLLLLAVLGLAGVMYRRKT